MANDNKRLNEIVKELEGASKMHLQQSKDIDKHIKSMKRNSPLLGMIQSPMKCWRGYERVPGTKEFSKGSCRKK